MMNLADKLTTDTIEHTSEAVIATCDDEIPLRQRPRLEYTVPLYGVSKRLDPFHAWKLVFIDTVLEIRHEKEFPIMVWSRVPTVCKCDQK